MGMGKYFRQRRRSFGYALKGIATLVRTQPHAQLHLLASVLVVGLGFYFGVERGEWLALLLAMGLVWVAEALNTALEFLTDRVSTEHHPLSGAAKDVAAGAVLLAALVAAVVGGVVFWPYLFA